MLTSDVTPIQIMPGEKATGWLNVSVFQPATIDVVGSDYATVAAEQTSLERLSGVVADQIVARLGLFATRQPAR